MHREDAGPDPEAEQQQADDRHRLRRPGHHLGHLGQPPAAGPQDQHQRTGHRQVTGAGDLAARSSVPVGAVLSGMVVSTGLIGWIRLLPLGETALPGWGSALVAFALTGSFLVVLPALLDPDPEISLGYSTVSQLGFVTVLIGAA
ncbi:hypothetical protein FO489_22600, partial [Bacillus licheniformis]